MGFFKRLFRKDPLRAFLEAETWTESQEVVEQHPELLTKGIDAFLAGSVSGARERGDVNAVRIYEEHRALLRRCREVGVEAAFAEKIGRTDLSIPLEVRPILDELSHPMGILDMPRRVELCMQALHSIERLEIPRLWAALQSELGKSLTQNPQGGRAENLERAIAANEQALEVRTRAAMPVEWATTMMNLASVYYFRIRGERAENLEQAIARYEQALEVRTQAAMPVEWAQTVSNLANAYADRIRGERAENLEQAIAGYEQALEVLTRAAMPVEWAETILNLATTYYLRIRGERAENLERAIAGYEQALEVRTRAAMPVEWATTMMNLATAYSDRIRGERAENLERAIAGYEQALEVMTRAAMPVEWATTMMNLANAYSDRIRGERAENLEQAIAGYEQALEVLTRAAMPVEWATTMMNLANAYRNRIRGERAENLERAIAGHEQALEVRTRAAMPVEWATTMMNLATAYSDRIRGERAENLERAIAGYEQALEVMTRAAMPVEWATTMMNLANAYRGRIRGERAENLERAIAGYEQALEVRTRAAMPVEWAQTVNSLALAYADRIRGERAENLERAIAGYEQALEVRTRAAMPVEWAQTMNNLANAYQGRIRGERAENLERAIVGYEQALEVMTRSAMPVEWAQTMTNLANTCQSRIRGERAENLERAIAGYEQALEVFRLDALPDDHRRVQRSLAHLFFVQQDWDNAVTAAQAALKAGELRYQTSTTSEARQAELGEAQDVPTLLSYALTRSETVSQEVLRAAVLVLEQNRARWLSEAQALQAQKPVLAPNAVWQTFLERRAQVGQFETELRLPDDVPGKRDYVTLSGLLGDARRQLQESIDQVRAYAEDFMPVSDWKDVQSAVTPEQPLVYIVATSVGGLALLVQPDAITPIWLDALTDTALHERLRGSADESTLGGYLGAYFAWRRNARDDKTRQVWFATLQTTLDWLAEAVMQPVVAALQEHNLSHAVLVPTDLLGLLPLHAAAPEGFVFTYTPNARALSTARETAIEMSDVTSLLAVDNPDKSLLSSADEVAAVLNTFAEDQRLHLPHGEATEAAVRDALVNYDVWHFSTHGWAGWNTPLDGGLLLADNARLTLRDLLQLKADTPELRARLAVLSACETGIPGTALPDEVISLPTGLLQAGVAGVVGTLWSVNDFSTAMLMVRFYEVWRGEGQSPPEALVMAQRWLQQSTTAKLAAYFKHQIPEFAPDRMPEAIASRAYWRFALSQDQNIRPFAHPFYWAGFYYTGV